MSNRAFTRRTFLGVFGAGAAGAALAACSTGSTTGSPSGSDGSGTSDAGAYPVTIKHALGTTTITKAPTRIATVAETDQDLLASLGIVPVLVPATSWGGNSRKSTDWFDAAIKKLGKDYPAQYNNADKLPVDEIAKATPDLILATNSGLTADDYAKLSKIAPTVAYPGDPWGTTWQDSLELVGKAVGKTGEAAALKDRTQKQIDDAKAKYPQISGKTATWLYLDPTSNATFSVYLPLDNRPRMLNEFGFSTPAFVETLQKANDGKFYADISAEKANTAQADVAVFYVTAPGDVDKLKSDKLLGQIPSLKSGTYVAAADNTISLTMGVPTTLSIPVAIEKFVPDLAKAAEKVS